MARLQENDRARVRHHLGYLQTQPSASIQLGFPSASEPLFLVERAMDQLIPEAVPRILQMLNALDAIELQMLDGLKRLKAQQLGELKLRNSNEEPVEQDLLEKEYARWAMRLSDSLGAPINPFSARFQNGLYGGAMPNIPISQV